MAELIRTACPQCDCHVNVTDVNLLGKKIRCPRCKQPFVVEAQEVEVPAESDRKPRKFKKKRKEGGSILPIVLIGGGVLLMLVLGGVGIVFFGRGLLPGKTGSGSGGPGLFSGGLGSVPELSGDLAGPWPEPMRMPALNITPENSITVHVLLEDESYKLSMQEHNNDVKKVSETLGAREKAISDRLGSLAHSGGSLGGMDDAPSGRARRLNLMFGPTTEDPNVFAKKIDFGSLRSVNGRVITLVVKKGEGPTKPAGK